METSFHFETQVWATPSQPWLDVTRWRLVARGAIDLVAGSFELAERAARAAVRAEAEQRFGDAEHLEIRVFTAF